jgi:hypothetical protein
MATGNADAGDIIPLVLILPRTGWVSHLPCRREDLLLRLTGSEIHSSVPVMRDPNSRRNRNADTARTLLGVRPR